MALTMSLTRDARQAEQMFRRAAFNVLACNRDDHGRNFSFLMDARGEWTLAPAYDLTFSAGPGGEQSTLVMGEGRNPGVGHLTRLGIESGLSEARIDEIVGQVKSALGRWRQRAREYGVARANVDFIANSLADRLR